MKMTIVKCDNCSSQEGIFQFKRGTSFIFNDNNIEFSEDADICISCLYKKAGYFGGHTNIRTTDKIKDILNKREEATSPFIKKPEVSPFYKPIDIWYQQSVPVKINQIWCMNEKIDTSKTTGVNESPSIISNPFYSTTNLKEFSGNKE